MNVEICNHLRSLREFMERERFSAFIFLSSDAHQSEYVPEHWKGRAWISGFDGSAGIAVVTKNGAALWTDSRYFLAAESQLQDTEFVLMREKIAGTPSIFEWLEEQLENEQNKVVGIDGNTISYGLADVFVKSLDVYGISMRFDVDPLDSIWNNRPPIPSNEIRRHPEEFCGESTLAKIDRIRQKLNGLRCEGMLVSSLDDIAWTLNLRGDDIHCTPVFVSYLFIGKERVILFVNDEKIPTDVANYLQTIDVCVAPYDSICTYFSKEEMKCSVLLDPAETSYRVYNALKDGKITVVSGESPIPRMKAIKNPTEINGFKNAMVKDGVALVKFLKWLRPAVEAGGQTEISVSDKLESLRSENENYIGLSFDTIVGYESHGAIVHYEADAISDAMLLPKGFLLLDSGAQYQDGTTDITRTIPLGPLTDEQRKIYTLVLRSHIRLEMAKFPELATGTQIDAICREPLWEHGLNFLHGTGHGVGSFLSVHEGPHQIRMEYVKTPLVAGMTVTDEPGIYVKGKFGVRIENTLLIKKYKDTDFGSFLQMEPLTLCPIDVEPIISELMEPKEINWLNNYHKLVNEKLSPYLNSEEKTWLEAETRPI